MEIKLYICYMNNKLNKSGQELVERMIAEWGKDATIEKLAKNYASKVLNGYSTRTDVAMLDFLGCTIIGAFHKINWFVRTDDGKKINMR
jgi:hypothetical protein